MSEKPMGIGLLGLGTVGRGVYRILKENAHLIEQRVGVPLVVRRILVRDTGKDRGIELESGLLTTRAEDVLDDPGVDIVVEVMGGIEPAFTYAKRALLSGKSLVTANKDMVAARGKELFAAAEAGRSELLFEASVGGGIPIIRPLKLCLAANRIKQVIGIINGTTNYMLTSMSAGGLGFEEALRQAQELGYAEADPTADVSGLDAARKLVILASIAFNTRISLEEVYVEGITRVAARDITYADELGYAVKLLAVAKEDEEGVEVRVHPAFLPKNHPLASVNGVNNAVFITGDAVGDVMFFGRGAGEMPTASAVVADIMYAARGCLAHFPGYIHCTCFEYKPVKPMGQTRTKYYLRLCVADRPGVLAGIAQALGHHGVSIASVIQKHTSGLRAEIVLVTHEVQEENLQGALKLIGELDTVYEICNVVRVEGERP